MTLDLAARSCRAIIAIDMQEQHTEVPAFTLRDARLDETDTIAELIQASYAQYEQRYFGLLGNVEGHLGRAQVIVAVRESDIAGCVMFYPDGSQSGQGEWPEGWAGVLRLAVHPRYRGQGIARALTEECIRRCRAAGIPTLALHATSWMAVSRAMYERMGFERDEAFDFVTRSGELAMGYRLDLERS
jgi:ribosomal protein S18 acetylase RimI-like enzyme